VVSIFLYGDDDLRIDERVLSLRQSLDPQGLSTTTIDVQSSTISEIATACQSAPFFGGERVVVLSQPFVVARRAADSDPEEEPAGRVPWADLVAVLRSCPSTTVVLMRHAGSVAANHPARKAIKPLGWDEESYVIPRGADLAAWVVERARSRSAEMHPTAATTLLDLLYPGVWQRAPTKFTTATPDTRLIASEIDKLVSASDGTIDADLVRLLVVDRGGYVAFELNNAVFAGQTSRALIELEKMLDAGQPAELIVASLASEAPILASLRYVREYGAATIAGAAGASEPRIKMASSRGGRIPASAHRRIALLLQDTDASIKAGRETASTVVAPLVAEIAEAVRMSAGPSRRSP
jgi:DNA polymerase III delta subunit